MTKTSTDTPVVEFSTQGPVGVITLNRPDQRNCVNVEVTKQLREAVRSLESDPNLRVGVLTGKGKVFCAGMDLKAFADGNVDEVLFGEGRFGGFVSLKRSKPIIAAVNGAALAGGLELMLACDMAIATCSTKFGLPEARVGLFAAGGGVFRLAQNIPTVKALELTLTGAKFSAAEAYGWGLLNNVVEDGTALVAAIKLASEIAKSAPGSVRDSLLLTKLVQSEMEDRLWEFSDRLLAETIISEDAKEGALAFKEKRPPEWGK
jgi:enoyl-CoA hydratase/carnithine racemase